MNFRDFFTITSWWGKILGACFGYLCGGPLGALFGLLVGNFFDKRMVNHFADPLFSYHEEKRKTVQKVFVEATFSIMGHLAKADGQVTQQELNLAKHLMIEMKLNKEEQSSAKRLFNEGKQNTFSLDSMLIRLKKGCPDNPGLLRLFIDIQYRIAQLDGLTTKKIHVLDTIFSRLGFAPLHQQFRFYEDFSYTAYHNYQEHVKQQQQNRESTSSSSYQRYSYQAPSSMNNLDHAYALLKVNPQSNKQEVKNAYRRLLSKNHPDKLIAQGLPEDMIKTANEKTQKIMKAYALICKTKGW